MARALSVTRVTPADELRELLTVNEKRVVHLRGRGAAALELLLDLDRIAELWPELEARGVDLRPELGRWETLQATVSQRAPVVARELRAVGGLPAARAQHHPAGEPAWWWFLAEQVQTQRARRLTRIVITLASTATVLGLLYFLLFHVLFPVDPNLRAAFDAQSAGERKIAVEGDLNGALADFRRMTELRPEDTDGWLRVGCTLLRLGDTAGAAENFRRAQALLPNDTVLRLSRAPICHVFGVSDLAEADLRAVIADEPENPTAHYYLATILEERGGLLEALTALERAADLAESSGEIQLVALARFRIGMLMQQLATQGAIGATPTP